MTNREKLAKMTNEELAEFIDEIEYKDSCTFCIYSGEYQNKDDVLCVKPRGIDCVQGILQWLEQESKE